MYLFVICYLDYGEFSEIDFVIENLISLFDLDVRWWYFFKCGEFFVVVNDGRMV